MSINNLFESKKLEFSGISFHPNKILKNAISRCYDLKSVFIYKLVDGTKKIFQFEEIVGKECRGEVIEADINLKNKIERMKKLFAKDNISSYRETHFNALECIGIFYNNELIAITNDEGKKCLDPLFNEIKDVEEFKKEFIKLKEVELEKERHMCEKRAEEICAEISHIIQHTS